MEFDHYTYANNIKRFLYTKSNKVNLRYGPEINRKIKLVYTQRNIPLIIVDEQHGWIKIQDYKKNTGWIDSHLLKNGKYAIVTNVKKHHAIKNGSKTLFYIDPGIIVKVQRCKTDSCKISIHKKSGFIKKYNLFGDVN